MRFWQGAKMRNDTTFLVQNPSFGNGIARSVDFLRIFTEYNDSASTEEADNKAIFHDWLAVFKDFCQTYKETILKNVP
jgi:hypothetical protein